MFRRTREAGASAVTMTALTVSAGCTISAFVEVVLSMALYCAFRSGESPWCYSAMAASLYASVIGGASRSGTSICTVEVLVVPLLLHVAGGRLTAPGGSSCPLSVLGLRSQ